MLNHIPSILAAINVLTNCNIDLATSGFGQSDLQSLAELMLRMSSVPIAPYDAAKYPTLEIELLALRTDGGFAFALHVRLIDFATILRDNSMVSVCGWCDFIIFRASGDVSDRIRTMLSNILARFANDFHRANPHIIQGQQRAREAVHWPRK